MNLPAEILERLLHGTSRFRAGMIVTVSRPIDGFHLVDRGMLSTSVSIPLQPGDRLEYRGSHLEKEDVVFIPEEIADEFLARIPNDQERSWVARGAFFVCLPYGVVTELKGSDSK